MSELIDTSADSVSFRRLLLTSVSALVLLAAVYGSSEAKAADEDTDRPTVWIELGGQLERMDDSQEAFSPPFMASITRASLLSTLDVQKSPAYSIGGEGEVSFQPLSSDWIFSASIRYGRSNTAQQRHHETPNAPIPLNVKVPSSFPPPYGGLQVLSGSYYPQFHVKLADLMLKQSETYSVLDFLAGKDVGLGLFGGRGSSVLSAGVRYVQFSSKSAVNMHAAPDLQYPTKPISSVPALIAWRDSPMIPVHFHDYTAMETNQRSFRGAGPSLAWKVSALFAGDPERGEITLDWGANAAILFGRQKVRGHHQTSVKSYYYNEWHKSVAANAGCRSADPCRKVGFFNNKTLQGWHNSFSTENARPTAQRANAAGFNRMRSVTVTNLGGFAGLSLKWSSAKISFGYRADFFFGAVDGGIDTPKSENRGFFGPFASASIELGG